VRETVRKWWRRFQDEGDAGLHDRSSAPRRCPGRTPADSDPVLRPTRRDPRHQQPAGMNSQTSVGMLTARHPAAPWGDQFGSRATGPGGRGAGDPSGANPSVRLARPLHSRRG
jgi:hypothetical protein